MGLDSAGRNDLALFKPSVTTDVTNQRVVDDIEGITRRLNALIRRQDNNTGRITNIINSPPSGGGSSGGATASFGPVWNAAFTNGLLQSGANYNGSENGDTIKWNSTTLTWEYSSFLKNTGSQVLIGDPASPIAGQTLQVWGPGTAAIISAVENASVNNAAWLGAQNAADADQHTVLGVTGSADQWAIGTAAKDGFIQVGTTGKRLWLICGSTILAGFNSTGLILGGTGTPGARLDVTAAASAIAALITGASGQIAAKVIGTPGSGVESLLVQTDNNLNINCVSTGSNAAIRMQTNVSPVSGTNLAALAFRGKESGASNIFTGANIVAQGTQTWSASQAGSKLIFQVVADGATALTSRWLLDQNGDSVFNQAQAALATSATGPFVFIGNMAGVPTGTPTSRTGNTALVPDTTHNCLFMYNGGWVTPKWRFATDSHTGTGSTTSKTIGVLTDFLSVDTSAGGLVNVTLPDATSRGSAPIVIKNLVGGLANVVIGRAGSDTVDGAGATTITLAGGQRCIVCAVGTDWRRID